MQKSVLHHTFLLMRSQALWWKRWSCWLDLERECYINKHFEPLYGIHVHPYMNSTFSFLIDQWNALAIVCWSLFFKLTASRTQNEYIVHTQSQENRTEWSKKGNVKVPGFCESLKWGWSYKRTCSNSKLKTYCNPLSNNKIIDRLQ